MHGYGANGARRTAHDVSHHRTHRRKRTVATISGMALCRCDNHRIIDSTRSEMPDAGWAGYNSSIRAASNPSITSFHFPLTSSSTGLPLKATRAY